MIDFFPTILDLCGVKRPDNVDGISPKPLLQGKKGYPEDRTLIIQCPRSRQANKWKNSAVKTDRWRLVGGQKLYDANSSSRWLAKRRSFTPEKPATATARNLLFHPPCPTARNRSEWRERRKTSQM
jgi:hypothetical protein